MTRINWLLLEVGMALVFVGQLLQLIDGPPYRTTGILFAVAALIVGVLADVRRRRAARAA